MRSALFLLPLAMLAAAGCGPNNDVGFYVSGRVESRLVDPNASPTDGVINFSAAGSGQARVDPTLPSGATMGFTGTCSVGPTGRTIQVTRVGFAEPGLQSFEINLNPWAEDTCTNCQHGTIRAEFTTAGSNARLTFTGTETRGGNGPSNCTFTASRASSYGMEVTALCTGMTAQGDARTLNVNATLSLEGCDGPESRNP